MKELHDTLRENIAAVPGLAGKTRVVPCGIEARGELAKQGVTPGSLDTITLGALRQQGARLAWAWRASRYDLFALLPCPC